MEYKIIGEPGDFQIIEQFGAYRISKKHFKTIEDAAAKILAMGGAVKEPEADNLTEQQVEL